jgi:hypothetical protein
MGIASREGERSQDQVLYPRGAIHGETDKVVRVGIEFCPMLQKSEGFSVKAPRAQPS